MRLSKRQMLTGLSVVWLSAFTVIAAIALYQANYYALPISHLQAALTIALPPLCGIALESIITFQKEWAMRGELHSSRLFQSVTATFLIYETALATLAGTALAPDRSVLCALRDSWSAMWQSKDADAITRIQDALQCCGFNSPRDMAFPFVDKTHKADACVVRYDRLDRCLEPWRGVETRVTVMLMVVPIGVFVWKLALFLAPGFRDQWLPSAVRLPADRRRSSAQDRAAIEYRDVEDADDEGGSIAAEVDGLNADSALASRVEGARVLPSGLIPDQDRDTWQ